MGKIISNIHHRGKASGQSLSILCLPGLADSLGFYNITLGWGSSAALQELVVGCRMGLCDSSQVNTQRGRDHCVLNLCFPGACTCLIPRVDFKRVACSSHQLPTLKSLEGSRNMRPSWKKGWKIRARGCIFEADRRTLRCSTELHCLQVQGRGALPELYEYEPLSVKAEAVRLMWHGWQRHDMHKRASGSNDLKLTKPGSTILCVY